MKVHEYREMYRYLTRKPLSEREVELAYTDHMQKINASSPMQVASGEERVLNRQPFYQEPKELVQDDSASPQVDSIPLYQGVQPGVAIEEKMPIYLPPDMAPVMPQAPGIPDPKFKQIELAEGGRAKFSEGDIVKASKLSELLKEYGIEVSSKNIGRFTKQYGIEKDPNRSTASSFYLEPTEEELKKIKTNYDKNILKAPGSTEAGKEAFKVRETRARELLIQGYNQTEANNILKKEFPQFKSMQNTLGEVAKNLREEGVKVVSGRESEIKTLSSKFAKERRELQKAVSDPYIERLISESKRESGYGNIDLAHRTSMKQNKRLGTEIISSNLGLDPQKINREIIKPIENELDPIYKKQKSIVNKINKEGSSLELRKELEILNKQVSDIVAKTDGRLQGILIDEYNLKPKTVGIDYSNVFGAGVLPDKPVSQLTKEEIALGIKQIPGQLKAINNISPQSLVSPMSNKLFFDPTGVGTFLETSLGQTLSKSAPNLLKTTVRLSTITGTPINALLGVALYSDEFKEKGLSDLETIAAGAYKGSTQDLLNFGDLIFRKLPVATYEKFVKDKPFLESWLNKPEYFEFADKQIDKYTSEKSIKDRIRNKAEYEVRKSFSQTISETEVPVTATTKEYENLIKVKENEILNLDPVLKKQYEQENIIKKEIKPVVPKKPLFLGAFAITPNYTKEEKKIVYNQKENNTEEPKDDLYIPPLNREDPSIKEGILNLAFGGRAGFGEPEIYD